MDVRQEILDRAPPIERLEASILLEDDGVIAGTETVAGDAVQLGLTIERIAAEGASLSRGQAVVEFSGPPVAVFSAEDVLVGALAKTSGVATRANLFVQRAGDRVKIVSGAWKKMPAALKYPLRHAVRVGGADCRIADGPFVYLDKNYVEFLGGVASSLKTVDHLTDHTKVVQIKGRYGPIGGEAIEAAGAGAHIIFVDTGTAADLEIVANTLRESGLRERVRLAFGGDVNLGNLDALLVLDVDILDIGREIVDAPLLDMKMEVTRPAQTGIKRRVA